MNTDLVEVSERFDLARTDGVAALQAAEKMVKYLADKCKGPAFISNIKGKKYPKVEWWTSVGAGLGLFPVEESCVRLGRPEEIAYEAVVTVRRSGEIISRGSAMCSSAESTWSSRDEHAIRSMAVTRATGKAYRIAFSFLAVMAGLEATPAEEMPENQTKPKRPPDPIRQDLISEIADLMKSQFFTDEERDKCRQQIRKAADNKGLVGIKQRCHQVLDVRQQQASEQPSLDEAANKGWGSDD